MHKIREASRNEEIVLGTEFAKILLCKVRVLHDCPCFDSIASLESATTIKGSNDGRKRNL